MKTLPTQKINSLRDTVKKAIASGNYGAGINSQIELVNILKEAKQPDLQITIAQEIMQWCYLEFSRSNFAAAYNILKQHESDLEQEDHLQFNMATILFRGGDQEKARDTALLAYKKNHDHAPTIELLARIHGALGDFEQARKYGETSMLETDAQIIKDGAIIYPIPKHPPPAFDPKNREENIISYSLWGDDDRYLSGALKNAKLQSEFYPQWTLRFYIEEGTARSIVSDLSRTGAQIYMCKKQHLPFEGLFWRFYVLDDPKIKYFLIRDTDSIFCEKEKMAVDAWLASGKYFHIMRDYFEQTDLIQAGLWGGVTKILPGLEKLLSQFSVKRPSKMVDQVFLNAKAWPTVKQSVLIHDSLYKTFGAQPFPSQGMDIDKIQLGKYIPNQ